MPADENPPSSASISFQAPFNIEPFVEGGNWSRWIQRFEGAFRIFHVSDADRVPYLLHWIGAAAFGVVCDRCTPDDPYGKSYAELRRILEEFYAPAPLEIAENYRFHQRNQEQGESLQDFIVALQRLSTNCKFGNYLSTALRNQFVFGLQSSRIRCRLLEMSDLTFDRATKTAISMDLSEKDAQQLSVAENNTKPSVNYTHFNQGPKQTKKPNAATNRQAHQSSSISRVSKIVSCFRCGGGHLASACTLPGNVRCAHCGGFGHLKKICFKKNRGTAHQVEDITENIHQLEHRNFREKYTIVLQVSGRSVRFELDSGSAVSVISKQLFTSLFPCSEIKHSEISLTSFCNTQIRIHGYATVDVTYKNASCRLNLYIANTNKMPLLGREWIRQLRLFDSCPLAELHLLNTDTDQVEKLLIKYSSITEPGLSKMKGVQARISLKEGATPIHFKSRTVPFRLQPLVETEIQNLVEQGVLVKVHTAEWATPVVPILKPNNKVRLCGDFKVTINKHLMIDDHPLPTVNELFATMSGGVKFSKIDLRQAYLQMEVRPEDRHLLTLNTHKGLYESTRLMYGIASAPAIFQREIENILKDIPGTVVFLDDIRVTAADSVSHLERLEKVFKRLQEFNIRINVEKCEFFQDEIHYCGYVINAKGLHKAREKMEAIEEMPRPTNQSEVRAYIGMINYYGKFIKDLSTILYPLNRLLCKDVPFTWTTECERAFQRAKREFQSDTVLAHFDPNLPLIVAADSSSYGVGAVLSQMHPDGRERVIQYASQTLSNTQRKYPQIDREAYSIIFAVKKFHQYLYGNKFTLITDSQPLAQIFSPTKALPVYSAMRMQHYALFLQGFNYDIKYKNTKLHCNADGLSRLPIPVGREGIKELDVVDVFQIQTIETLPLQVSEIAKETLKDPQLSVIIEKLRAGSELNSRESFNVNQQEYSIQQDVLLRGHKVVIPVTLRKRILRELHQAHFGIVKTKALARGFCWWPGIDSQIEEMVRGCELCGSVRNNPPKVETHIWEPASFPFERIHLDFAGPFLQKYFLIIVDAYSKFPVVKILDNITSQTTIKYCREIFATFGLPKILVTDNGPQLVSKQFKDFLKSNGIIHKLTAPFNPATNGEAERFVQTLKKSLTSMSSTRENLEVNLQRLLITYRITPHSSTHKSPSELIFNKKIRSRLDFILPTKTVQSSCTNESKNVRFLEEGDRVQCRNYIGKEKWKFGRVIQRQGKLHFLIQLDDDRVWRRHVNQILRSGTKNKNVLGQIPYYAIESDANRTVTSTPGEPLPRSQSAEEWRTLDAPEPSAADVAIGVPKGTAADNGLTSEAPVQESIASTPVEEHVAACLPSTVREAPSDKPVDKQTRTRPMRQSRGVLPTSLRDFIV